MRTLKPLFVLIFLTVLSSGYSQKKVFTDKDIQIIPKPNQLLIQTGSFEFSKNTVFVATTDFQKEISNALINKFGAAAGWRHRLLVRQPCSGRRAVGAAARHAVGHRHAARFAGCQARASRRARSNAAGRRSCATGNAWPGRRRGCCRGWRARASPRPMPA